MAVIDINAPPIKTICHADAIISGGGGTAKEKIEALEGAGVWWQRVLVCSLLI